MPTEIKRTAAVTSVMENLNYWGASLNKMFTLCCEYVTLLTSCQ